MTNENICPRMERLDWGRDGGPVSLLSFGVFGFICLLSFLHPKGELGAKAALGLSVLLVYGLGRELGYRQDGAFLSAAVYLSLAGIWPEGGLFLGAQNLTLLCGLLSRRDPRWSLGLGLGLGLWSQLAPFSAPGAAFVSLGFLAWDTPRLWVSPYFGGGFALGLALLYRNGLEPFLAVFPFSPWFWAVWVFPWALMAAPQWWRLSQSLNWSWGKFCLSWGAGYGLWALGLPSPTLVNGTPLLLITALLAGRSLGTVWSRPLSAVAKPWRRGLRLWGLLLLTLGVCGAVSGETLWGCLSAALGGTFLMGAYLLGQGRREAVPLLLWGQWVGVGGLSFVLAQAS